MGEGKIAMKYRKGQSRMRVKTLVSALFIVCVLAFVGVFMRGAADGDRGAVIIGAAYAQDSVLFKDLQWRANVLVVTGGYDEPRVKQQLQIFQAQAKILRENDMAVIRFVRDRLIEQRDINDFQYRGWFKMNARQQGYVERQIQSDNDVFSVVLIGKNGVTQHVWAPQADDESPLVSLEDILGALHDAAVDDPR